MIYGERSRIFVSHERLRLVLAANSDVSVVPSHPEASEFSSGENIGSFDLDDIWFSAISANDRLLVAPTANEDLEHRIIFSFDS